MMLLPSYSPMMTTNYFPPFHQQDARDEQKEKILLPSIVSMNNVHIHSTHYSKNLQPQKSIQTPVEPFTPSSQRIKIQSLLNDDNSSDLNCDYFTQKSSPTPAVSCSVDEKQTLNAAHILASISPSPMVAGVPVNNVTTETTYQPPIHTTSPQQPSNYELSPSMYSSPPEYENSSSQSDSDQSAGSSSKPKRAKSNLMLQMCSELWMKHYTQLKEYHKIYGNTNVTRTKPEWKTLGNWVAEQRRKLKNGKLSREQLKLLNALGFEWDRQQYSKGSKKTPAVQEESQQVQFVVLDH